MNFLPFFMIYFEKMDVSEWIKTQKDRMLKKCSVQGPHNCWICLSGGQNQKYSTMSVSFPWAPGRKTVLCHRFSYMLFNNNFEILPAMHVSHRCHQRHCVNPEHLSLEPNHVNMDRQICRDILPVRRCKGHPPYQDCLL